MVFDGEGLLNRKHATIAIITARGGSKRIPNKNIREFCGRPMIAYSIEAAVKSCVFNVVMVSTDSRKIADIAASYGAEVPFMRSQETSNDYATTADVLGEVLECYGEIGKQFDIFACLYPTAPFITAQELREAMDILNEKKADTVMPVIPYSFPPQRGFVERQGYLCYLHPENERTRSQDLEKIYHDAGQYYICRVERFLQNKTLVMPHTIPVIKDEMLVQDIDTEEDWKMAEMKYMLWQGRSIEK